MGWQLVLANNTVLECYTVVQNQPRTNFSVTLNEQKLRASHKSTSGIIDTNAIINGQQISYQYIRKEPFGMQSFHSYLIHKSTLKVIETITTNSASMKSDKTVIAFGFCKAAEPR